MFPTFRFVIGDSYKANPWWYAWCTFYQIIHFLYLYCVLVWLAQLDLSKFSFLGMKREKFIEKFVIEAKNLQFFLFEIFGFWGGILGIGLGRPICYIRPAVTTITKQRTHNLNAIFSNNILRNVFKLKSNWCENTRF